MQPEEVSRLALLSGSSPRQPAAIRDRTDSRAHIASPSSHVAFQQEPVRHSFWTTTGVRSVTKRDVQQGTLALMALKTLEVLGPLHGYGIARRIEQISSDLLAVNQGTLYPVLLKLEQEGAI